MQQFPECTGQSPQLGLRDSALPSGHTGPDLPDEGLGAVAAKLPRLGGTALLMTQHIHPGEQVPMAHVQGPSHGQWQVEPRVWRAQLRAPVLHRTEALLWLWDLLPPLLLQVVPWGSVSSTGPSQGDPPWLPMPNATILNLIPCVFQAGQCALVLCPPRAGPGSRAKLRGIYPPTLPGYGFKAAEQCKLGSPGPARLLLHAQECQRLLSASCAAG